VRSSHWLIELRALGLLPNNFAEGRFREAQNSPGPRESLVHRS